MNDKNGTELLDSGVIYSITSMSLNDIHNELTITFEDGDKIIVHPNGYEDLVVKIEPNKGVKYIV